MGLFGLGTPEIAIIAGVALLVLGPDQVKKLAKDVGKISAELKQVREEFNKGMEVGQEELARRRWRLPQTRRRRRHRRRHLPRRDTMRE